MPSALFSVPTHLNWFDFFHFTIRPNSMAKVTYITPSGNEVVVEDAIGNLMEIAREYAVEGIEGACSGCCSCATCHVRVKPEWLDKTGRATEAEQDLIDLESDTDERSRLSCQIEMSDELDGLVVEVAPF